MSDELEEGLLIAEEQRLREALAGLCELPLRRPKPPVPPQELTIAEFFEIDSFDDETPSVRAAEPSAPATLSNGSSSLAGRSTQLTSRDEPLATGEFLSAFNWE